MRMYYKFTSPIIYNSLRYQCSKCEEQMWVTRGDKLPNYCPYCGEKVEPDEVKTNETK